MSDGTKLKAKFLSRAKAAGLSGPSANAEAKRRLLQARESSKTAPASRRFAAQNFRDALGYEHPGSGAPTRAPFARDPEATGRVMGFFKNPPAPVTAGGTGHTGAAAAAVARNILQQHAVLHTIAMDQVPHSRHPVGPPGIRSLSFKCLARGDLTIAAGDKIVVAVSTMCPTAPLIAWRWGASNPGSTGDLNQNATHAPTTQVIGAVGERIVFPYLRGDPRIHAGTAEQPFQPTAAKYRFVTTVPFGGLANIQCSSGEASIFGHDSGIAVANTDVGSTLVRAGLFRYGGGTLFSDYSGLAAENITGTVAQHVFEGITSQLQGDNWFVFPRELAFDAQTLEEPRAGNVWDAITLSGSPFFLLENTGTTAVELSMQMMCEFNVVPQAAHFLASAAIPVRDQQEGANHTGRGFHTQSSGPNVSGTSISGSLNGLAVQRHPTAETLWSRFKTTSNKALAWVWDHRKNGALAAEAALAALGMTPAAAAIEVMRIMS